MVDPSVLRDRTQIVVGCDALAGIREELETEFRLTIDSDDGQCRIIASPVVIQDVGEFLIRRGIAIR